MTVAIILKLGYILRRFNVLINGLIKNPYHFIMLLWIEEAYSSCMSTNCLTATGKPLECSGFNDY